jgi:DNA-binding response OmpR family regulator
MLRLEAEAARQNLTVIVDSVSDGETRLERALDGGYDLVILYVMLPGATDGRSSNALEARGKRRRSYSSQRAMPSRPG